MGGDDMFRACDADRERAVEVIRDAYVCGRLDLEEFHERTAAAFAGRTWGDLRSLTSDLPAGEETGPLAGPRLPSRGPRASGPPGGPFPVPVLPIAVVWLVAALSVHSPAALIPIVFLLIVAVRSAVRFRGDPPGEGDSPPRDDPAQRPGGPD